MLNNVAYVLLVALALMMPLSIYLRNKYQMDYSLYFDLPIFILATMSLGTFYACSQREIYPDWKKRLLYLPLNLALGVGMAVNNSRAVFEALLGRESSFQRTAKYAISKRGQRWQDKKYKGTLGWGAFFEFALGLYFTGGLIFALSQGLWATVYCLLMFQVGFLYVGGLSLFQGRNFFQFLSGWKTSSLPAE